MHNCDCDPLALTTAVNTLATIAVQRERCRPGEPEI